MASVNFAGAFNTTTGPVHWELLQRARAVDNQLFVAACSPARSLSPEGYQVSSSHDKYLVRDLEIGHLLSCLVCKFMQQHSNPGLHKEVHHIFLAMGVFH
jgi:hypothetical protein